MSPTDKDIVESSPLWQRLVITPEGRIFVLGLAVSLLGLIIIGIIALWSAPTSRMIGAMAFTNIVFGRAVSMTLGYAAGYGHALVVSVNMVVETILVLLFYPVFVFSLKKLVVLPTMKRWLDRIQEAAVAREDMVRRYGIIGLLVFVWFPFWMTGPVVGSAIGYLLGFSPLLTLSVVLAGTYIAMAVWAWFLFGLQQRVAELGPFAPILVVLLIAAIVGASYYVESRRKKGNRKPADRNGPGDGQH